MDHRRSARSAALRDLAADPQSLYDTWKSYEMQFRRVRNNMEQPELSPPFKSYREAWTDAFVDAFRELGLAGDPQQAAAACVEGMGQREPFEDTMRFLDRASQRWTLSLLTNADDDFIAPLLERHGLSFRSVVTSESARSYKPAAAGFLRVLRETGVSADEAVYVGDSPLDDVHGARLVGNARGMAESQRRRLGRLASRPGLSCWPGWMTWSVRWSLSRG